MPLQSMTGFARADGTDGDARWHWEARSVNGRGLDLRMRLPPGHDGLEPRIREAVTKRFTRGSINLTLTLDRQQAAVEIRLNEQALAQVLAAAERVSTLTKSPPPSAEALLGIRGVLEIVEGVESEERTRARAEAMLASLEAVLEDLAAARTGEGARLGAVIEIQLHQIEQIVARLEVLPVRKPAVAAERLREAIARVIEHASGLDPARIHQEAVLLATRADVEEELKRLAAHLGAARDLIKAREPVGRRFDFLSQEFNREANTLCSKSNDAEMTRLGLDLKALIDQMREQVQNIE